MIRVPKITGAVHIAWRTVGAICKRVAEDARQRVNRLATLRRIGIDEISYRKNHRYLTVVVDHDTGLLVWAAPGRDKDTVDKFFDLLGQDGCQRITMCRLTGRGGSLTWSTPDAKRGARRRSVPRRVLGYRRTGQGAARGMERRPRGQGQGHRAVQGAQECPLGVVAQRG